MQEGISISRLFAIHCSDVYFSRRLKFCMIGTKDNQIKIWESDMIAEIMQPKREQEQRSTMRSDVLRGDPLLQLALMFSTSTALAIPTSISCQIHSGASYFPFEKCRCKQGR